uniref:Uncharacterized protein n=1 Tax=Candidatus Kentrum sp. LFY TaxID=2126342 RepID=A0A450UUY9_9GAMM|nr:MAG: hypothetical protein BECKLFY1418B_GA0070995_108416 [Candidatus Kentron sp. LFY]
MSSHKVPSLHVGYKPSKIKQYFKEDHALRTETTINNTYDFGLDCRLENLPDLRAIGFAANCHLLEVETISQDCSLAEGVFEQITRPRVVDGKRVSGLRFDDHQVIGLLQTLCGFLLLPNGFSNASMRQWMAQILGIPVDQYSSGRMTYDLRRLRLHGPIERIPHTHRYQVTEMGTRVAFFFTKIHSRISRPGLSESWGGCPESPNRAIANAMNKLDQAIGASFQQAKLAPCETRSICEDDSESKLLKHIPECHLKAIFEIIWSKTIILRTNVLGTNSSHKSSNATGSLPIHTIG